MADKTVGPTRSMRGYFGDEKPAKNVTPAKASWGPRSTLAGGGQPGAGSEAKVSMTRRRNQTDAMRGDAPATSTPKPKPVAKARPAAKPAPKKAAGYSADMKSWAASERAGIAKQRAAATKPKPAAKKTPSKSNRGLDSYKKMTDY